MLYFSTKHFTQANKSIEVKFYNSELLESSFIV